MSRACPTCGREVAQAACCLYCSQLTIESASMRENMPAKSDGGSLLNPPVAHYGDYGYDNGSQPVQRPSAVKLSRGLVALTTCGLYLAACALPCIHLDEGGYACTSLRFGSPIGLVALLLGWLPPFTVAWLANPFWLVGMIYLLRRSYTDAYHFGWRH